MNRLRLAALPAILACALTLGACSSDDDTSASGSDSASETADATFSDGDVSVETLDADLLAKFSSCDDVAPAVEQYIEGLDADPNNGSSDYGVYCTWSTPASAASLDDIRTVEVMIETGNGAVSDTSVLGTAGLEVLSDSAVESKGGVAYTMNMGTDAAGITVTTVEFPDVRVSITGGQWADSPSLDGPAAVAAATEILGL
ncbi:hypothetical protein EV641_10125 [Rhodococcus sp. SMB37]|uniref:hypothetical protein n=1 Tax=Rhodococcus sp. SMB37 TaxID=2512213 RepID=UPI000AA241FB|nr:hypothetical protein [Rhodococcus sp. SMB37]TCN57932.1 hypothetical protein EV641_10125 [Rhodococcus sp. SMB37]